MPISWVTFYVFLFVYRCAYSYLGYAVISQLTSLGDSGRIIHANLAAIDVALIADSPLQGSRVVAFSIAKNLGSIFYTASFNSELMVHVGFQSIAFIGLLKLLMSLEPRFRKRVALIILLPSFSMWSSVASKETLVVFSVSIVCAYIVDIYYHRERLGLLNVIAFALLPIFKPMYLPSLGYVIGVSLAARHVNQKAALAFSAGLVSLIPLYIFRDSIDALAFRVIPHFAVGFGRSTREPYWTEQYDVFWKAPYGMFQSFFGPTLAEATTGILQIASFIESAVLVGILLFYLIRRLPLLPAYNFILVLFATFWLLFPTYPLGIMNPGSAIRYRTGYLVYVVIIFAILTSREVYGSWRAGAAAGGRRPMLQLAPSRGQL